MNTNSADDESRINLKLRQAQIEQLYRQTWGGLLGVLVIAATVCVILSEVITPWKLHLWAGSVAALSMLRAALLWAYQRRRDSGRSLEASDYWGRWHVAGVVLSGVQWSIPTLWLWPASSLHQLIWTVCILPLSSVAVATYCTWTPAYLTFLLLTAVPVSLRLLGEGGLAFTILGLLGLFFTGILALTGRIMHKASINALSMGLRNEALNMQLRAEVAERAASQQQLAQRNQELERALGNVKQLSGLLPICGSCKKIRNDKGYWEQIEAFIRQRSEAQFSHGICPDCARRQYPDIFP